MFDQFGDHTAVETSPLVQGAGDLGDAGGRIRQIYVITDRHDSPIPATVESATLAERWLRLDRR